MNVTIIGRERKKNPIEVEILVNLISIIPVQLSPLYRGRGLTFRHRASSI